MSFLGGVARQGFGLSKLLKQTSRITSFSNSNAFFSFSFAAKSDSNSEALEKLSLRDNNNKRISSELFLERLNEVVGKDPAGKDELSVPQKALDLVVSEYDAMLSEIEDINDKYRRSLADKENVRSRGMKEVEKAKSFAIQSFSKDLLEVADVLDMALSSVKPEAIAENKDVKNLNDGVTMMKTVLLKIFEKHGLTMVSPEGEKFDPSLHEAVFQLPKEQSKYNPGDVGVVMKVGYSLKGRPIRPAQVGVVKE